MKTMRIELASGEWASATYVRHLRTLTHGSGCGSSSTDLDLYRLADGREIVCSSPECDGRAIPVEVEGETPATALFRE